MQETKPSLPPATPPPPSTEPSSESETLLVELHELRELNEQLLAENSLARQELAAVNPVLLSFGAGVLRRVYNARSIRDIGLTQKTETDAYGASKQHELWAVQVDNQRVSDYLPPDQAEAALARTEHAWSNAITPPSR